MPPAFVLPDALADEVCAALGVGRPRDRAGVDALYRAWAGAVPFDTIVKSLAIREGRVPPADPTGFCERWLATGVGGMCWGHCAALAALLGREGIECSIGLDRMQRNDLVDFHAFVVADVDGERLALDPIHTSGDPLPFVAGARGTHPVLATGFDAPAAGGLVEHWFVYPSANRSEWRYSVLSTSLDADDVRAFCEVSIHHSGMGAGTFRLRRTPERSMIAASPPDGAPGLQIKVFDDAGGITESHHEDLDEAFALLGYRDGARQLAERAGLFPAATGRR